MIPLRVTRRYVQGVIEAAQAEGKLDGVETALATIDAALKDNKDVCSLLFHPMIPRSRKKDLLRKIAAIHGRLILTKRNSERILALAKKCPSREEFERRLPRLVQKQVVNQV